MDPRLRPPCSIEPNPPPPQAARLGPIYLEDALSFLKHPRLERCRLVSVYCDKTIVDGRSRGRILVRQKFSSFEIDLVSGPTGLFMLESSKAMFISSVLQ